MITLYGIRHHGPGSARSLHKALISLQPDIVLIEGPADASHMLSWAQKDMEPPVALLVYRPDKPERAGFFPFAVFSPEWQAIQYALAKELPVRFMDLPQGCFLASEVKLAMPDINVMNDLGKAAGYNHYESYWNSLVEQRQDDQDLFEGVLELMQALRDEADLNLSRRAEISPEILAGERLAEAREAYMRQTMFQAQQEGFKKIAVVCGAWHAPSLTALETKHDQDAALIQSLDKVEIEAAWVPWSYSRLASWRGYGAGIQSPGWYHYLWEEQKDVVTPWLSQVAHLLRSEGFDASSAHVIETVRLAETLAAIRGLTMPGLPELMEATQTVMCFGDTAPMQLIQKRLIVGERYGSVPPDSPMTPLQRDVANEQRRLKLRPELSKSTLSLDLRNEAHLERSHFLHRLRLLNIPWGQVVPVRGKGGTYREVWSLQWSPEFTLRVVEASQWGNTVLDAANQFTQRNADEAKDLAALTQLLDQVILADLPEIMPHLMKRIEDAAATTSDILRMIDALQPLVRVLRYGSVRHIDKTMLQHVVDSLVTRICLGLPRACQTLNNDAASDMLERINTMQTIINMLAVDHQQRWKTVLLTLIDQDIHGLLAGRVCRLLLDNKMFRTDEAMLRLERALFLSPVASKTTQELLQGAFWLEGFLKGSGLLILHDSALWQLIDDWINAVEATAFIEILPLLRRTFSSFNQNVRQQITERVKQGEISQTLAPREFDKAQAEQVLPLIARLLGARLEGL
jgi:Family of unknown function (DUF5682)